MNLRKKQQMYQFARAAWPRAVQAGFGHNGRHFTADHGARRAYVAEVAEWIHENTADLDPRWPDARYRCIGAQTQYVLAEQLRFITRDIEPIWARLP